MEENANRVSAMSAHQRENWFPRLHAAAVLAGTYTAAALLVIVDPRSIAGVPFQVLIPAGILAPFFMSFVLFAPASFGLYWLMERFDRCNLGYHCLAGIVCVALTFTAILFAGFVTSLLAGAFKQMEEAGVFDGAASRSGQLFLASCALSGMVGGVAFYLARKVGISGGSIETASGGRS
ncbi:hypothetical protein ACQKGL_19970 [Ensifer adhaerens]|uniref:hypothetical protein n=1 Tax=Ensifer adhaerens TaxID=106592 RepID=UPI003CFE11DD